MIPAAADQFDFLEDVCSSSSSNVAAVLLGYDLVPESLYPTQLEQAAGLVTHLVKETGKKPDNVCRSTHISFCKYLRAYRSL